VTQEKTILVMDDDDAYLEVMQEVLDCLGYSSIFAKNGEEALVVYKKAKESNNSLAAIILDLRIEKGVNGEEGAKLLLAYDPKAKVIVSSGLSNHPMMIKPQDYGLQGVLLKPFGMPTLRTLLNKIFENQ